MPRLASRRRILRASIFGGVVLVVLAVAAFAGLYATQSRLAGQVQRIEGVFDGLEQRPERPTSGPGAESVNILLMGTDRRSDVATTGAGAGAAEWVPGAQRTDTIMVLHLDADRETGSLISIPRDSWVAIPGYGEAKINAAFSFAGPSLAVATVEQLTGLRMDHLAVVDWSGFEAMIDEVGGVTVKVPRTVTDSKRKITWTKGEHFLDGERALKYVGQRYGLPNGDLDRVRRQQAVLRALLAQSMTELRSSSPLDLYDLLDTATQHVSVDEEFEVGEMRDLLLDVRGMRKGSMHFLTAPVAGFGWEGEQSVVYLDGPANAAMWRDVREDRMDAWLDRNPGLEVTGPVS
ncbi:LCP family protein [Nocardioides coralli]|uniref:LCP family protein n=1 Tax=Nocardioides coralli TaxID=2872154 RepID=UPI001CA407C4|nr:LCP family protein [Nocardioides coralli]QZY29797.1 LCP family protein [Nocardioides coralli]